MFQLGLQFLDYISKIFNYILYSFLDCFSRGLQFLHYISKIFNYIFIALSSVLIFKALWVFGIVLLLYTNKVFNIKTYLLLTYSILLMRIIIHLINNTNSNCFSTKKKYFLKKIQVSIKYKT